VGLDDQHERVILVGLSGTGKTTIAQLLAAQWGWNHADLDAVIESTVGCSIQTFFENLGESEFRRREREILERVLSRRRCVIATGGGAPCTEGSMDLLLRAGIVVWLRARTETLVARLRGVDDRPLLSPNPEALRQMLLEQIKQREGVYQRAHLAVDIDGLAVEEIVAFVEDATVNWGDP
jgi:shikimate kinase